MRNQDLVAGRAVSASSPGGSLKQNVGRKRNALPPLLLLHVFLGGLVHSQTYPPH